MENAHRRGLEPLTTRFEAGYSIRLSYRCLKICHILWAQTDHTDQTLFFEVLRYAVDISANLAYTHGLMTATPLHTEGIVLRQVPYGNYDQIATLFTHDVGVLALFIKGGSSPRRKAPLTGLTCAEIVYQFGRGDLAFSREVSIKHRYHESWNNYSLFESGAAMAKMLLDSQLPGKTAPQLYALFRLYLERLGSAQCPAAFVASFGLKILKHDGLARNYKSCSSCHDILEHIWAYGGEAFCRDHAPSGAVYNNKEDTELMMTLMHTQSFSELTRTYVGPDIVKTTRLLFEQGLDR